MFDTVTFIPALKKILLNGANEEQKLRADNIIKFMTKYASICGYLKDVKALTEHDLCALKESCNWLGKNFPIMFPHRVISPKLHMLFVHVPEFAEKHHNLGIFSESAFESLHGEFNSYDRTYACVSDNEEAMRLLMQQAEVKRSPEIKQHVRERRKCAACRGYIAKDSPVKEKCQCKTRKRKLVSTYGAKKLNCVTSSAPKWPRVNESRRNNHTTVCTNIIFVICLSYND